MAESDDKKTEGKKPDKAPKPDQAAKSAKAEKAAASAAPGAEKPAKASPKAEAAKGGKPEKGEKTAKPEKGAPAAKGEKGAPAKPAVEEPRTPARLKVQYDNVIKKKLTEQFKYQNPLEVPRLEKIVINMGIGEGTADRKKVEQAAAGPESGDHRGAQVDCDVQGARRPGDRLQGDAAQIAHVRIH